MRYGVILEKLPNGYAAYVPDLPGCKAFGKNVAEVQRLIESAIQMHIEAMRVDSVDDAEAA